MQNGMFQNWFMITSVIWYCTHCVAIHGEQNLPYILCVYLCGNTFSTLHSEKKKKVSDGPQKSKETSVILERNVTFLCSWLSPVSPNASHQEVLHNGSKLPETQSQTRGTEVGGRQRKLCQGLLADNNLSDLAINVSKDKTNSGISWGCGPF